MFQVLPQTIPFSGCILFCGNNPQLKVAEDIMGGRVIYKENRWRKTPRKTFFWIITETESYKQKRKGRENKTQLTKIKQFTWMKVITLWEMESRRK